MIRERRSPDERRTCPRCSHARSSSTNRAERVMSVWFNPDGSETNYCHHCQASGSLRQSSALRVRKREPKRQNTSNIAAFLWQSSLPAKGTPVEVYLREGRGLDLKVPATIRYLAARMGYPHAMITAFGLTQELEPGVLAAPDLAEGVHIIRLTSDGRDKLEKKRMLGTVAGKPLVLAPPNDGLGLAITEGIEDALSVHQATGLGAWAAGSASQLPKLVEAVPEYTECVSIFVDPDDAGEKGAAALAEALLRRGFEVHLLRLAVHD